MNKLLVKAGKIISRNAPTILTGFSTLFTLGGAYFIAKETPKAMKTYNNAHEQDEDGKLSLNTIVATAKEYKISALMMFAALSCQWSANTISVRRLNTLYRVYGRMATESFDITEKAKELLGDAGVATLLGATAAKSKDIPTDDPEEFDENGELYHWFYDTFSDVWMRKTWLEVKEAYEYLLDDYFKYSSCRLNTYYNYLNAPEECYKVDPYDELVWDCDYLFKAINFADCVPIEYGECVFLDGVSKGISINFPCPPVVEDPTGKYDIFDYRYAWPMIQSSQ